jgi:D-beta-D-heptose 7-phosphate kinase/D-beta-D-heptose 1-phosphate adenosyltransferase
MSHALAALLNQPLRPRLLVVGDVILDRYLWGDVERISPEAPIPLLKVDHREARLGGAGSVAAMLCALGAEVELAAVLAPDVDGAAARALLRELNIGDDRIVEVDDRPTTVKERLLGRAQSRHPQQMMRVDYEEARPLTAAQSAALAERACQRLDDFDLVLVSDYNKGACAGSLVTRLVDAARQLGKRVVADPVRGGDYGRYAGCECITPNRLEAALATGQTIDSPQAALSAAQILLDQGVDNAIVTLDRDGMVWRGRDGRQGLFPVRPRQVYDITGAGDMVLATIGFGLAAGLDYPDVIELANVAGGLEVERLGAVPIARQELIDELSLGYRGSRQKVLPLPRLLDALARRRQAGQRIVMTNGCFDLLHPGHIATLEDARALGDCLVVGVNSDRSVRELKGPGRPVLDEANRAHMLAALECVDHVVIFDDTSVAALVAQIRPEILAKSAAYAVHEVVGHEIVLAYGGEVRLTPMQGDFSTTRLIHKIASPVP